MDRRHFEGFLPGQRRQDRREPLGQHGLARTRRSREQQMVSPGRSHLQGLPGAQLPCHIRQVRDVSLAARRGRGQPGAEAGARDHESGEHRVRAPPVVGGLVGNRFVAEDGDELAQAPDTEDRDARHQGRLPGRLLGDDDLLVSGLGRREDGGQHAPYGTDPPVQAQLADHHDVGDGGGVDPLRRAEDRTGDSKIETRTTLGDGGRGEPHRELLLRPVSPGIDHRGPHPVPALDQALVRQPDQREGRHPGSRSAWTSTTTPSTPTSATEHARAYPIRTPPCVLRDGGTAPGHDHSDQIDPDPSGRRPAVPLQPDLGEPPQPLRLDRGDRGHGMFEPVRPAGLHLAEDQRVTVPGDDVDLSGATAPVALDHGHSGVGQQPRRQILAVPPECPRAFISAPPPAPTLTRPDGSCGSWWTTSPMWKTRPPTRVTGSVPHLARIGGPEPSGPRGVSLPEVPDRSC
ncbi:hypothetical protein Smic_60910 [Streptomyces microflavus]|uniref:Uncharacterized protein n=1 Tax=Streptomyces microflavus TaxID=1919 RepID=A0A7J0D0K1_STRMI|nr:hypothetical protein Smic_60910 [Streptomyces microflavus]